MSGIETSIEVERPVRTFYDQWTRFEEFPRFMEGVEQVRQLDDTSGRAPRGRPRVHPPPRRG